MRGGDGRLGWEVVIGRWFLADGCWQGFIAMGWSVRVVSRGLLAEDCQQRVVSIGLLGKGSCQRVVGRGE